MGGKRTKKTDPAMEYAEAWAEEPWGTVKAFVHLYNFAAPDSWPAVELVSPERKTKIEEYLQVFPAQKFWETVYRNAVLSKFLSQEYGYASMDWLIQVGKDGVRNCLKVYEGKYNGPKTQR